MPAVAISALGELLNVSPTHGSARRYGSLAGPPGRSWRLATSSPHVRGASFTIASAPTIALAISYVGIVFACLWRGRLRWIGIPMAFAVSLWPRPPAPVAWIAADGDDAAIVVNGQEIALKPDKRAYATQLWAQRRGFTLPEDATVAQKAAFDCNRNHCSPLSGTHPALAGWWTIRQPKPDQVETLCAGAEIVVTRATTDLSPACAHALVLSPRDFAKGGAAEVFKDSGGWRVEWAQPIRGQRPWTDIQL